MKIKMAIGILVGCILMVTAQAQSTPSCSPAACGPENTKTKEARVITNMRSDLQGIIDQLSGAYELTGVANDKLQMPQGANDDESLEKVYEAALTVREALVKNVPSEKLLPALREDVQAYDTKQQLVKLLKNQIQLLSKQVDRN